MSTETSFRQRHGPVDRLALALVDILTGEVKISVTQRVRPGGTGYEYQLNVAKADDVQDS